MKSQAEKWFIQQMWNQRREIMVINERYKEHRSIPNDGGAHSIHRGYMVEYASELAKARGQSFDFTTEMRRVNDAYRVRR